LSPEHVVKSSDVTSLLLPLLEGTDGNPGNVLHLSLCPFLDAGLERLGDLALIGAFWVVVVVLEFGFDEISHL